MAMIDRDSFAQGLKVRRTGAGRRHAGGIIASTRRHSRRRAASGRNALRRASSGRDGLQRASSG